MNAGYTYDLQHTTYDIMKGVFYVQRIPLFCVTRTPALCAAP